MRVRFTKGHSSLDFVSFRRDGRDVTLEIPKEPGCMPRAMARSVVERVMGRTSTAEDVYLNPDRYHAGASSDPTWQTTELLLKVLQDELATKGEVEPSDISFQLRNVSQLLMLPRPVLDRGNIDLIAKEVIALYKRWSALPAGRSIELNTSVPLGQNAVEEIEPFCVDQDDDSNNNRDN
jgi:hypothetical protein